MSAKLSAIDSNLSSEGIWLILLASFFSGKNLFGLNDCLRSLSQCKMTFNVSVGETDQKSLNSSAGNVAAAPREELIDAPAFAAAS